MGVYGHFHAERRRPDNQWFNPDSPVSFIKTTLPIIACLRDKDAPPAWLRASFLLVYLLARDSTFFRIVKALGIYDSITERAKSHRGFPEVMSAICRAAGNLSFQETDSGIVESLFRIAVEAIQSHIDFPDVVEPATWMFTNYYGATFAGRDPGTGIDIIAQVLARYPSHLKVNCKCCHALNNIVGERKQWAAMMVEKKILHMILDRLVPFAATEFTTPAMDLLVSLSGVPDGAQHIASHLDRVFAVTIPLIRLEPFDFAMASSYKPTVSHHAAPAH